jgi:hypothetical protein
MITIAYKGGKCSALLGKGLSSLRSGVFYNLEKHSLGVYTIRRSSDGEKFIGEFQYDPVNRVGWSSSETTQQNFLVNFVLEEVRFSVTKIEPPSDEDEDRPSRCPSTYGCNNPFHSLSVGEEYLFSRSENSSFLTRCSDDEKLIGTFFFDKETATGTYKTDIAFQICKLRVIEE